MTCFRGLLIIVSFLFAGSVFAKDVTSSRDLVGAWHYYKKVYKGADMPEPPEATLRLYFNFYEDGTDRLFWTYEGTNDWCERSGKFTVEKNILKDEIVWVNPHNSAECDKDPDMQLGRIAETPISLAPNGDLEIHLFIDQDPLLMVWKRLGRP